jgi:hypothetical protein
MPNKVFPTGLYQANYQSAVLHCTPGVQVHRYHQIITLYTGQDADNLSAVIAHPR